MAYGEPGPGGGYRARFKRPDGKLGSKSGFSSEKAAKDWGDEQEGIARVYDHVTPMMRGQILNVLEARWLGSLAALTPEEQVELVSWFPHLRATLNQKVLERTVNAISISAPSDH